MLQKFLGLIHLLLTWLSCPAWAVGVLEKIFARVAILLHRFFRICFILRKSFGKDLCFLFQIEPLFQNFFK